MAINLNNALGIHEQALLIREKRASLLASNIANADTPHYKAKDIDFAALLSKAKSSIKSPSHQQANSILQQAKTLYRVPVQPDTGDGNTVDSHYEKSQFAQNAMSYQVSLHMLGNKMKGLIAAIRGE